MKFDPSQLPVREVHTLMTHLIAPRPIAWISTVSQAGVNNLAPYSFFNGVGAKPPALLFCPANRRDGQPKDSLRNVLDTGQFVVNVVSARDAQLMYATSAELDPEVSEFDQMDIATVDSVAVQPPRVADSVAQFECKLWKHIQVGQGPGGANIVIGEILMVHVDDSLVVDDSIDASRLDNLGRLGDKSYCRTSERFEVNQLPGRKGTFKNC